MSTEAQLETKGLIQTCPNCGKRNRVPFPSLGGLAKCGSCSTALPAPGSPVQVDDEQLFDSLVSSAGLPVIVDFWAEWCGPCKMMAPELERVAARVQGRGLVAKVNTESVPALAQRFQIAAIPTLVLFVGGSEKARLQGARPAAQIEAFMNQAAA